MKPIIVYYNFQNYLLIKQLFNQDNVWKFINGNYKYFPFLFDPNKSKYDINERAYFYIP
jgi:hypothetical protein